MFGLSLKEIFVRLYMALRWRIRSIYWIARRIAKQHFPRPVLSVLGLLKGRAARLASRRYQAVLDTYEKQGCSAASKLVDALVDQLLQAKVYNVLARKELAPDVNSAAQLARQSIALDGSPRNRIRNCMVLWDSGCIQESNALLVGVSKDDLNPAEQEKALQIEGAYRLYCRLPEIPESNSSAEYVCDPKCILYVASSSQPYHTTGYTTRTHHLLESLKAQGWVVHCVTRPGYPNDRPDSRNLDAPVLNIIDGVPYERIEGRHRREVSYDQYLMEAADRLEQTARRLRPVLIHAASNYEAALPALIAARRLGIPFCYEVRGLWEYTAASKKVGWEQTERFELDRRLEAYTAVHAGRVFTLTKALAAELVSRGVAENRIELMPNAVNLSVFTKVERDQALADELGVGANTFVCGYIGSVVKYEGLDDLIAAMPTLILRVPDSKLLVVGDGDELVKLREQATQLGVVNQVVFTGKVPHGDVTRYFSLLDTIALPRKPYTVCKLVSPLKPFEAMAMRVPLVVSDVDALGEIFVHGETALLHEAGDPDSLAQSLIQLAESPVLRQRLADNAFAQVSRESQWSQVIRPLGDFYAGCGARPSRVGRDSPKIRLLTVGSLPPEWGGGSQGGVATIHGVVLNQWLGEQVGAVEVVGVLANNWSGRAGPELPDQLRVFVPPQVKSEECEWYCSLLQQERIDCVLFFHIAHRWAYWHTQFCKEVPAVGAIHSWHAITMQPDLAKAATTQHKVQKALIGLAGLIFPSQHCVQEGESLGFSFTSKLSIVPNSLGREFLDIPLKDVNCPSRIVFVGSLIARKRADLLIRAAVSLGVELLIIGEGDERSALERLACTIASPGQVRFLGSCAPAQVAKTLVLCSVLCVPSASESFGIVYLEAIACGIPVVGFAPTLAEIETQLGVPIGRGVAGNAEQEALVGALQQVLSTAYDPQQLRNAVALRYGARQVAASYMQAVERALQP